MKHQPPALSQTITFGLQRAAEARTDLRGYLLAATTRCSLCRQAAASGPGSGPCSWAATRAANLCSSSGWASLRGERADRGVRAELRPSQSLKKLRDRPDSCHPPPKPCRRYRACLRKLSAAAENMAAAPVRAQSGPPEAGGPLRMAPGGRGAATKVPPPREGSGEVGGGIGRNNAERPQKG